ncbi:MAG: class I fructose-bisphosphate aldolase [Proteobacteria bacterium]|jgi:fructose-bisphosphate aldolase, class I|nr:class I fructose-bisphosphate aldolase [Pseudomonadota bacterium]
MGENIILMTTRKTKEILSYYESDNPATKANLYRFLHTGALAGTGKLVILPVDQGFEHGPERSFAPNVESYDPHYHFQLAIDAKLNGYAAPLGMIEAGADTFAGRVPLILKMNSNNSLMAKGSDTNQAVTATIKDAIRLGCNAIGFTIYPASNQSLEMYEEVRELIAEAKSYGLVSVVWSYARGGDLPKEHETSLDVISYSAHIACLLGAHIIKVKPPKATLFEKNATKLLEGKDFSSLSSRIALVKKSCFNGRRIVIFSGGEAKGEDAIYSEIAQIAKGGGNGSIIGRNTFQRPKKDAIEMLGKICGIYKKA